MIEFCEPYFFFVTFVSLWFILNSSAASAPLREII